MARTSLARYFPGPALHSFVPISAAGPISSPLHNLGTAGSSHSRPFAEYPLRTTETTTAGISSARRQNNIVQRQYVVVMRSTGDARQLNTLFWINPEQTIR
jgi:hypothetical protein